MDAIRSATATMTALGEFGAGEAALAQGIQIRRAKEAEAKRAQIRAGQERATGQRAMLKERRKEEFLQSALQARAAASGAGATDPTVLGLAGDIAAEGEYRALSALFEGEDFARGLEDYAAIKTFEGAEAERAGRIARQTARRRGVTSLLKGFSELSLFSKYGEPQAKPWVNPDLPFGGMRRGSYFDQFYGP